MAKFHFGKIFNGLGPQKKISLNKRLLRNAGVGILIHDPRWDLLFTTIKKPPSIIKAEDALRSALDEKTRLRMENNMNQAERPAKQKRIDELSRAITKYVDGTTGAAESARAEILECETRIAELDARARQMEQRNDELEDEIMSVNLALLEDAVSYLYRHMKKSQSRVTELDKQIPKMRETLKDSISERETLDAAVNETYHFLHGLLGAEQIESLDDHYTLD